MTFVRVSSIAAMLLSLSLASIAAADDGSSTTREAGRHFQRGVALYGEADYRAALVEFRRAYAVMPNVSVLYNIGETQYQLQDYASALTTFERYLAESSAGDAHRAEVETSAETLRSRVGHVTVVTIPPGADVTIDDQSAGRTPIDRAILVSIGHRKIVAAMPGRPPATKYVDVATDDNVQVTLQLGDGAPASPSTSAGASSAKTLPPSAPEEAPSHAGATWRLVGWTATGVFAASAITMGILADKASNDLAAARATYPTTAATLNGDASTTSTYAVLADSLGIAAVVVGAVTLISQLTSSSPAEPRRGSTASPQLALGLGSARLAVSF